MKTREKTQKHAQNLLARNRRDAYTLAERKSVLATKELMQGAANVLRERIALFPYSPDESFTAAQMRVTLQQVEQTVRELTSQLGESVVSNARAMAEEGALNTAEYLQRVDRSFRGLGEQGLPIKEASMMDQSISGVESTVLRRLASDPEDQRGFGILARYGLETVKQFESAMQIGLIAKKPWAEIRDSLVSQSPFLQGAPSYWTERIVRTEMMGAYNRASWESIRVADDALGDMVKILSATFDNRTGSDSYAVHGQIRRVDEPFEWWEGKYMHPPNRPNDREIVVPHRVAWPIPDYLRWRSGGEIMQRWRQEKRRGSPPPRPNMTTIPLKEFGREDARQPKPMRE